MKVVSEQQTFAKLRIAPIDFAELCEKDPDKALEFITQMQGDREKAAKKTRQPKDPNQPKQPKGRPKAEIDFNAF